MITLSTAYQELGRSESYAFSDLGQVRACLYARIVGQDRDALCSTVAVKLTRIITGSSSGVGYSHTGAQATLSGSLTHAWSGGASGTVYVGEHTVFEQTFSVYHAADGTMSLSLAAVYDDTYITARSVASVTCALPAIAAAAPSAPPITSVVWDTVQPTRYSNVTLSWEETDADYYNVSICRLYVPGDPGQGGEAVYTADLYTNIVTFGLASLPLAAGDDVYFMVQAVRGGTGGDNGFSGFYTLRPTLWHNRGGWLRAVPWVCIDGAWLPARGLYVKADGTWRASV